MIWALANIHFDDGLYPYFLKYYRKLGVQRFGLIVHDTCRELEGFHDTVIERSSEPYTSGERDNQLLQAFRQKHLYADDWYIPADLDEFYWTQNIQHIRELTSHAWDYVPAVFYDRFSLDGKIHPLDGSRSLDEQFPLVGHITEVICHGCPDKVAIIRGSLSTTSGHHRAVAARRAPFMLQCHHFKWCGAHFWDWINYREGMYNYIYAREVLPFRNHFKQNGRINVYDGNFHVTIAPTLGI